MRFLKQLTALLICAVMVMTSVVCAAGDVVTDEPGDTVSTPLDNEGGETGEPENPDIPENPDEPDEPEKGTPELVLSDSLLPVTIGASRKITAEAKNFETQPESILWSSADTSIATVDKNGIVTGRSAGRTEITATATDGETTVSSSCVINVNSKRAFAHLFLSINYQYTKMGDYFYSNNDITWQMPFGFVRVYDNAAQLIGYQYDFTRVVFTYGKKDWLIEFWKGQYGLFQMGAEIGVYTKYAVGFGDTVASAYQCAARDEWLDMEMSLWHNLPDGSTQREFTREYGKYWWCDGYKVGKLNKSKPATELQMVSRITLKDEEMAAAFAKGMINSGFKQVDDRSQLTDDSFCREGSDVYFTWRNLTEDQALVPITIDGDRTGILPAIWLGFEKFGASIANFFRAIFSGSLFSRG